MDSTHILVVLDSTLRFFNGGGDKDDSLLFAFVFAAFLFAIVLSTYAVRKQHRIAGNLFEISIYYSVNVMEVRCRLPHNTRDSCRLSRLPQA